MSTIQYPVPIHPRFIRQALELETELKDLFPQFQILQQRIELKQGQLRQLLQIAKEVQIEAGQVDNRAVIDKLGDGVWIEMPTPTDPTTTEQEQ